VVPRHRDAVPQEQQRQDRRCQQNGEPSYTNRQPKHLVFRRLLSADYLSPLWLPLSISFAGPRENANDAAALQKVADWRDVLQALPRADAIFACLGPALEIFSRHSRVEKATGERIELKEYLEQVWAAVSKEALSMIFEDASIEGFEPDTRLTAMWLWTLAAPANETALGGDDSEDDSDRDIEDPSTLR
jgi:hypothetical protein